MGEKSINPRLASKIAKITSIFGRKAVNEACK